MNGDIAHHYQSSLLRGSEVCVADDYGRIAIVDPDKGIEVLDSELNLFKSRAYTSSLVKRAWSCQTCVVQRFRERIGHYVILCPPDFSFHLKNYFTIPLVPCSRFTFFSVLNAVHFVIVLTVFPRVNA